MTAASLLVFADDWGRHPSSCQHLVARLLPRHPVTWVNTIGMRRPSFDRATLRRGLEKIGPWLRQQPHHPTDALPSNLRVIDPKMWPWFSRNHDRWINCQMLQRALAPHVRAMPRPLAAITTLPIVADLMEKLPVDRWIYYCVDDFSTWPGLDHKAIDRMERKLVKHADRLIAASETLQSRIADLGREAELLTHGVDLAHWQSKGDLAPPSIASLPRPLVLFWGLIDPRMDAHFVQALAAEMTEGSIVLAGPVSEPDPQLMTTPRVAHLPPLKYSELPALAAQADVLVMPYRDSPVTRAMQPLKLKEYLATGRPVVVRRLPATEPWGDCLDLAETPAEFVRLVKQRIVAGIDADQLAARNRLGEESWDAKAEVFEHFVTDGLEPAPQALTPVPTRNAT